MKFFSSNSARARTLLRNEQVASFLNLLKVVSMSSGCKLFFIEVVDAFVRITLSSKYGHRLDTVKDTVYRGWLSCPHAYYS